MMGTLSREIWDCEKEPTSAPKPGALKFFPPFRRYPPSYDPPKARIDIKSIFTAI